MDYYIDGFSVDEIDCWNLSIAVATGIFEEKNYYLYCYIYTVYRQMRIKNIVDATLDKLGLVMNKHIAKTKNELLNIIYDSIESFNPVLLALNYNAIFFNSLYMEETDLKHLLLIRGCDRKKGIVIIRDYLISKDLVKSAFSIKAEVFSDLTLKAEYVADMWEVSKANGVSSIFSLHKKGRIAVENYNALLQFHLNEVKQNIDTYLYHANSNNRYEIRRTCYRGVLVQVSILKKLLDLNKEIIAMDTIDKCKKECDGILSRRSSYILYFIKELETKHIVDNKTIEFILDNDKELKVLVEKIYILLSNKNCVEHKECNLALRARVYCDSEIEGAEAYRVADNKMESEFDCWLSAHDYSEHWIILDLENKYEINKFIVRHHPEKKKLVTVDYRIEGSNDMDDWDTLVTVTGNKDHINIHYISAIEYRYIKLHILKANAIEENAARIFSFEIYNSKI